MKNSNTFKIKLNINKLCIALIFLLFSITIFLIIPLTKAEYNSNNFCIEDEVYECSDGLDNDDDGLIDALIEIEGDCDGGTPFDQIIFGRGNTHDSQSYFHKLADAVGLITGRNYHFAPEQQTAEKLCALTETHWEDLGLDHSYPNYVSHTLDDFSEPQGDYIYKWSTEWGTINAVDDMLWEVTCEEQCSPVVVTNCRDGIDNDNDGYIDYPEDEGCNSIYDISEIAHDPGCEDPEDDSEDNPQLECCTDGDCSDDYYSDNYCIGDDAYKTFYDFSCIDDECEVISTQELVEECDYGCTNGQCNNQVIKQCSDGIDNDGDSLIDLNDPGCEDPEDDDEHNEPLECCNDSDCGSISSELICIINDIYNRITTPICASGECDEDTIENFVENCPHGCINGECIEEPLTLECSDGFDNDNDNLIDEEDPGCWDDTSNPLSYNLELDDESDSTIICSFNSDCGDDGFLGNKYCEVDDVYQDYQEFNCNNPGLGTSFCSSTISSEFIKECDEECEDGRCVEDDEDRGGFCYDENCEFYPFSDSINENIISRDLGINKGSVALTSLGISLTSQDYLTQESQYVESRNKEKTSKFWVWFFLILILVLLILIALIYFIRG